tara:strand:+ start:514 stop:732 length:219 start_codon:yes stop_codon:yes gene_type:complete
MRVANDNDCCTEAIEILANIWDVRYVSQSIAPESARHLPWDRIGAFLAIKGIIDRDIDPPDESNRNLEGEDL